MYSLQSLHTSCENINAALDEWVTHLRASSTPDFDALEQAVGILYRLTAIEKTLLALQKQTKRADTKFLKKLCNGIATLHNFFKLVNTPAAQAALNAKPTQLPPLGSPQSPSDDPDARVLAAFDNLVQSRPSATEGGHSCPPPTPSPTTTPTSSPNTTGPLCGTAAPGCDSSHHVTQPSPINANPTAPTSQPRAAVPHNTPNATHKSDPSHRSEKSGPRPSTLTPSPDPFAIPRARLNHPTPRKAASLDPHPSTLDPCSDPSSCNACSACTLPLEFHLDPRPSTLDPDSTLPKLPNSIPLLPNWHNPETQPDLLASFQSTLQNISHRLVTYFKNLPEKPKDYIPPAGLHTGLPIIQFFFPPPFEVNPADPKSTTSPPDPINLNNLCNP